MPKIDVNKVAEILKKNEIEPALLRQIVEEMNITVQPDEDKEPRASVKKQFVILVSDPDGKLIDVNEQLVGWVLQIPENESVLTTQERVYKAAYEFNTTKKGRLMPVRTMGDALEHIQAYKLAEAGVWNKTLTPVLMLRTDNEIPRDEAKGKDARRGRLE